MKYIKGFRHKPFFCTKQNLETFIDRYIRNSYSDIKFQVIEATTTSSIYIKISNIVGALVLIRISDHATTKQVLTYYTENGYIKPCILAGTILNGIKRLKRKTTYYLLNKIQGG